MLRGLAAMVLIASPALGQNRIVTMQTSEPSPAQGAHQIAAGLCDGETVSVLVQPRGQDIDGKIVFQIGRHTAEVPRDSAFSYDLTSPRRIFRLVLRCTDDWDPHIELGCIGAEYDRDGTMRAFRLKAEVSSKGIIEQYSGLDYRDPAEFGHGLSD